MTEAREAEEFNKELDKLLSGERTGIQAEGELREDLAMAQRLSASDMSDRTDVKHSLRAGLLGRADEKAKRGFFGLPSIRRIILSPAMVAACVIVGVTVFWQAQGPGLFRQGATGGAGAFKEGWSVRDSGWFGKGGSPYEPGVSGMAPGGLMGASQDSLSGGSAGYSGGALPAKVMQAPGGMPDIITPLHVRDSALLAARGQTVLVEGKGMEETYVLPGVPNPSVIEPVQPDFNTEAYARIFENPFRRASDHPLSTFSIDVDAASYANARRFLGQSRMPPPDAVRIEEFVNYFRYDYPEPKGDHPFSIITEVSACPWKKEHKLVHIGLKGKSMAKDELPPNNLVFLVDSSGSMQDPEKLPLLKKALRLLVEQLGAEDRIAIVTYAGAAGLVLPSTPGNQKTRIIEALDRLEAGGSTAGSAGIELAYRTARENLMREGNNRVILATDGDFNVGVTSEGGLTRLIEAAREQGIFLTVLGFGMGNYKDSTMETLADKGNGNYAYIDDIREAKKVLVEEMGGTLQAIAKDVKLQVEFNPAKVQAYRLIGYENRMLQAEDFNDDKKDAGELGAGHTVTALYEVVPVGVEMDLPGVDKLKYQKTKPAQDAAQSKELLTVKFRYKDPDGHKSKLITRPLDDGGIRWEDSSENMKWSAAVAGFGMLLRGSKHAGNLTYKKVESMAEGAKGKDEGGYRTEFIKLVESAQLLDTRQR